MLLSIHNFIQNIYEVPILGQALGSQRDKIDVASAPSELTDDRGDEKVPIPKGFDKRL